MGLPLILLIVRADGARGNVTAGLPLQHHSASDEGCASSDAALAIRTTAARAGTVIEWIGRTV
jgi:hypothetical protein